MCSDDQIGIGVIGVGSVSGAHIDGFRQARAPVALRALCDVREDVSSTAAALDGVRAYRRAEDLIADPRIDAVSILLPHALHYAVAKAALVAGKHVAIEKPMAVTTAQCEELVELAQARNLTLAVCHNSRFVEAYLKTAQLLGAAEIGPVRLVRGFICGSAVSGFAADPHGWRLRRHGVGAIIDAACHFFYLYRWLFGEIETIQAVQRHWLKENLLPDADVEDSAIACGRLAGGSYYTVEVSLAAEIPWSERLEVYGSEGSVIVDQLADPPMKVYRGPNDLVGEAVPEVRCDVTGWKDASIRRIAQDFAEAIHERRPPAVTGEDGLHAVRAVEKAYESVRRGGVEVTVA